MIGDGGAVLEKDDVGTLARIVRRLRRELDGFPWADNDLPGVAAGIKTAADDLDDIVARLEGGE